LERGDLAEAKDAGKHRESRIGPDCGGAGSREELNSDATGHGSHSGFLEGKRMEVGPENHHLGLVG
jgi:hypothetical protein